MPDTVTLRDSSGRPYGVPQDQVSSYLAQGFHPETDEEGTERAAADTFHEEHGGAAGAITSGVVGGLSGLTLGASDLALGELGAGRAIRHIEAEHPYAAGIGQFVGALAPTILTGGAAAGEEAAGLGARILAHSPAGLVSRAGGAISGLGEGAGIVGRTLAGTAGAAAEGAFYGGGQYLAEAALEDKPLSAEGFVAGMGHGALFAAPIGAAGTLASATLQRARSLFPRSEVSAAAAAGVKSEAASALGQAVRDGDVMAQAAERKLSDIDAGTQVAQVGETATRRVFGEAHPQAIADQVTGTVQREQVTQAIEGYQQAREQLHDWIASEADPELEKALSGLAPGELQTPAVETPRVPVGEFGAPGARGIKTPDELQRALEDSAPGAIASREDVTGAGGPRALRGGPKGAPAGVPAQEIVQSGMAEQPATAVGKRPAVMRDAEPVPVAAEPAPAPATEGRIPGTAADRIEVKKVGNWRERKMEVIEYHNGIAGEPRTVSQDEAYELLQRITPPGFRAHQVDARANFTVAAGIPKSPAEIVDNAIYVVKPSELAERGILGNKIRPDDLKRGAEGFADANVKFPTVEIDMAPNGEMWVMDGNHRVQNAAATDRPMAVRFRAVDMTRAEKDAAGLVAKTGDPDVDISGRIKAALPASRAHAAEPVASAAAHHGSSEIEDAVNRFDLGKRKGWEVKRGLPTKPEKWETFYVIKPSELAEHPLFGDELHPSYGEGKMSSEALDRLDEHVTGGGKKPRPILLKMGEGEQAGKIQVEDGNHRLQAAARRDEPVVVQVQWPRAGEAHVHETRPIGDRVRAALPGGPSAATDTLTGQLRGMQAKLAGGENLAEMGRAPAAAARAEQLLRHPETADRFMAKAESRLGGAAAEEPEVGDATMARILAKHGLGEPAPRPPALSAIERQVLDHEHVGISSIQRDLKIGYERARVMLDDLKSRRLIDADGRPLAAPAAAEPDALAARILRNGEAAGNPSPETAVARRPKIDIPAETPGEVPRPMTKAEIAAQRDRFRALAPEQRAAKAIMRHNGKGADMGPDLARAAKVIGDVEEANAKLVDILGPEAPPQAAAQAQAYRATVASANDRAAASTARTAQDLATKARPAVDATVVDDDVAKALRRHESRAGKATAASADATVVDDSVAQALRQHDMRAPAKAGNAAATAGATDSGIGGRLADAGAALEVLRAIGAHVPVLSHIPIIGPVLGLWLKARAVMGILGRKGGSIGKSTEGLIASKAAATRDRIVAATGTLLEGGARAAGKVAHLAGPAVLLADALFPGGKKPASDKPRDLFDARVDDIVRAQQPGAIDQAIAQRYPTSDPAMHDAIVAQVQRGIAFLDSKRPKQTVLPGVLPGDGTWKPSAAAIEEFGKYVHAVNDPVSVLEDLAKGHPSAEGAETLRVVYPELYRLAQKELLQAAPEMARTLPYPRRVMLSILYQIPVDGTMQPSHAQYLQVPAPAAAAPKAPAATSGPLRLSQQTLSPLDQRASGA